MQPLKQIKGIFNSKIVPEGNGAQVIRIIGTKDIPNLNPFLMLDYGSSKLPAGFPDHPHRGFETVSYMIKGKFYHEDSKGNKGTLESGDVQWMTAGRGVVHSEMPASFTELSSGFQLWVNLQAKHKMCQPQYQEYKKSQIPEITKPGLKIKLIAGEAYGQKGIIITRTPAFYMDVLMEAQSTFEQNIPSSWNSLCFLYEGEGVFQGQKATLNQAVHLKTSSKDELLKVNSQTGCKFILIAGEPINEPIAQYGPFVMNTQQELEQAFKDYQLGINGFEGAKGWKSQIRNLSKQQ